MNNMFENARAFNQRLEDWDTKNVKSMAFMFIGAVAFNQRLNDWDTGQVVAMSAMFNGAVAFNQRLEDWVGRCRLTVSKPELKACPVSALETKM
jgi:hypothetical protein